jgi:RND family efflux transporter MFP subunit
MSSRSERMSEDRFAQFATLHTIRTPRIARFFAWATLIGIAVAVAIMTFAPWVQTASGPGELVALNPDDRPQPVTALVPGRVDRWFVQDGQLVRAGDKIAKIADNDPNLIARLQAQRLQVVAEIEAARAALATAELNVSRNRQLFGEGLLARRDYEAAQIAAQGYRSELAVARAKLNQVDVSLDRQSTQVVYAPRAGRVQGITAAAKATYVSPGDPLATIVPLRPVRVLQMYVDGRDVALIHPGRPVRIAFEGWPAIQFSGWPGLSGGLFDGQVRSVDHATSANGLFRVLIDPVAKGRPWPSSEFLHVGAKARGWIQMETVSVGYELWRRLNDFPLEYPTARTTANEQGKGQHEPATIK